MLRDDLGSMEAVLAVLSDYRTAGLPERDVAMLSFAETVAVDASAITPAHIERLRAAGFRDPQICDIALCASLRCFMSRFFDATGAGPEAFFLDADETVRKALTVGRVLPPPP
jgi:alkylhydroperoxidase family enzyme